MVFLAGKLLRCLVLWFMQFTTGDLLEELLDRIFLCASHVVCFLCLVGWSTVVDEFDNLSMDVIH